MAVFVADERAAAGDATAPVDVDRLHRLARHVLAHQRIPDTFELSVLCVDAATIGALNERHMGKRGPTDVLAFPMDLPGEALGDEPAILGDVVLCPEVAARQAAEHGVTVLAETELLVVHGILHLLGYDHADAEERSEMFGLTDRLLAGFRAEEDGQ